MAKGSKITPKDKEWITEALGGQESRFLELQLQAERAQAEAEKARLGEKKAVVERVHRLIKLYGINPREVFSRGDLEAAGAKPKARQTQLNALYVDPDNPEHQWNGVGRKPAWLNEKIAAGASKDDFLVSRKRED